MPNRQSRRLFVGEQYRALGVAMLFAGQLILTGCGNFTQSIKSWLGRGSSDQSSHTAPFLSISDVQVTEGNAAAFTITNGGLRTADIEFQYATQDGTGVDATDYTGTTSGTATISAGTDSTTVTIPTIHTNGFCSADRTFTVHISSTKGVAITKADGTGTIQDADLPTVSVSAASAAEGNPVNVVATLNAACPGHSINLQWSNAAGTARAGIDYTALTSQTATIPAGQTTVSLATPTSANHYNLGVSKTFDVTVASADFATITTPTATGTITQVHTPPSDPTLSLTDPTTASATFVRQDLTSTAIGSDTNAVLWCLSETQTTAPALGTSNCVGGIGASNGWSTIRPTTAALTTGQGARTLYLWIADANNNVNVGPISASITIDSIAPATPTVAMSDPNTASTVTTDQGTVDLAITSDTDAVKWCAIEQSAAAAAPTAPLYNNGCWVGARPTTQVLSGMGSRKVYVYTQDTAKNVSTSAAVATINFPTLSLTPSVLSIITGESTTFAASGGTPGYTYSDAGSGYLNAGTHVYSVPLSATATTDTVTANDSGGHSVNASVNVRAFQTKDNYQYATRSLVGHPLGVTTDNTGLVFSIGSNYTPATGSYGGWWVQKSVDNGATWTTSELYNYDTTGNSAGSAILADANGTIFAAGVGAAMGAHLIVRKSIDHGTSWTTAADITQMGYTFEPVSMATDANGYLWMTLKAINGATVYWQIRKSINGGGAWTIMDEYNYPAGSNFNVPYSLHVAHVSGDVYVAGSAYDGVGDVHWLIRKSTDGGATWSTIEDLSVAGNWYEAFAVNSDAAGNVYVVGTDWQVRKTTNGGSSWTQVDITGGGNAGATAKYISITPNGNIFVSGQSTGSKFIIRKSADSGATWTTIDTYGTGNCSLLGMSTYGNNNIYLVGDLNENFSGMDWAVRYSSDQGSTWAAQTSNFAPQITAASQVAGIAASGASTLYAVGRAKDSSNKNRWLVRKSTDLGVNWTNIDTYFYDGANKPSEATGVHVDGSGAVWVYGSATDSSDLQHWIVRRSTDAGSSWAVIDDYSLDPAGPSTARSIAFVTSNTIYVAGDASDNSGNTTWVVRKTTNNGTSWTTMDNFNAGAWETRAEGIAFDSGGNIYAAGFGVNASFDIRWFVRKSSDAGATWSTVDDFVYNGGTDSQAYRIQIDSSDRIFVVGQGNDSTNYPWIVRASTDAGATWSTKDAFIYDANGSSSASDLLIDTSGNLFVTGLGGDNVGKPHFVTRKSADHGTTWVTLDDQYDTFAVSNAFTDSSGETIASCGASQICVGGYLGPNWYTRILSP